MRRTTFDEEHELFRASFRQFLDKEVVPRNDEFERAGIVDRGVFARRPGEPASSGMAVPEELRRRRRRRLPLQPGHRRGDPGRRRQRRRRSASALHNDICLPYFLHATDDEQQAALAPRDRARRARSPPSP